MKKFLLIQSVLFILWFSSNQSLGQSTDISFRQISPPGGFTLKGISAISQDQLGYIWMGTRQGIIRYNSQKATWFIPSPNDSLSLPNETINEIYVDKNNTVWIATNRGLCTFDRQQQGFKKKDYTYEDGTESSVLIRSTLKTEDGRLLIADSRHFGYLDINKNQFIRIASEQIISPSKIYKDNYNRIWIGTDKGEVYRFYPSQNKVKMIVTANGGRVNTIHADNDRIWVGFDTVGAKMFNSNGEVLKDYSSSNLNVNSHSFSHVRIIKKDTYGRLWVGAYEGLFMYDGNKFIQFAPDDYPGLPYNSVYEIFEDRQGEIWIGTYSGGVALVHHSDNYFQTYRHSTTANSISNNTVSSFLQINKNELLIGTEVGGLNSFNLISEKFELVELSETENIKNIKSLCKDKYGGIWVGTFRKGLWYRQAGSATFKLIKEGSEDGNHISSSSVYSMCAVDSGIWIGTFPTGVNFYSYQSKSIRFCFQNDDALNRWDLNTNSILADSKSNLWLGTLRGLYKIHLPSGNIAHFEHNIFFNENGDNVIYYLWEHSSGDIWIGTKNKGILIFHPKTNQFEAFYCDEMLAGKDVYGIIEDQNKVLWISSNNGIVMHNPKDKSNRHFIYHDGIQSNLFCPQSVYKDDKENLYFGGTNGFTKINPYEIKINSKKPYTIINELVTKQNRFIYPNYSENLTIDKIILAPGESTLRINFSADNYLMPKKNKYKYRLNNYYDDWVETQNEGSALFKSLKAGEYIFEVKACNNDGIWNDVPTQMQIEIKNFWYRTTYAYIAYLLLFTAFLYFIGRFYFERLKLKRAILLEKNQRENEEQIHEMKLKFFTNISHEFRTPLTLISWPLKRLINAENITSEQREELEVVNRNSKRLLQLINQIIDLRKLEKGKSKLNISKIDLIEFIKEMQQGFSSVAKSKEIDFVLESSYASIQIEADQEKLDTIIYNLLSNAYKYVSEKGQIRVSVNKTLSNDVQSYTNQLSFGEIGSEDFVEISVEDSGSGIDSEDLLNIFNRFEQGKHKANEKAEKVRGSGIGLSLCKEYTLLHQGKITAQSNSGKGSRFTVLLPTKQKAQKILFESHQEFKNLKSSEVLSIPQNVEIKSDYSTQILVVEDNIDFSSFLSTFLGQYYKVKCTSNGEEALAILKHHNVDLVLSDVMMPKMDGFEFCSLVKTQIETSHIPIILLTALSSSENLISGLDKGADAYLTKPFDENILLKQIENILQQRKRIHENFVNQFISKKTVEVGNLDNFFLNRVKAVIEKNISNEHFGMEKLADELMISRSQLHRKIKSLSGVTSSEFVNLIRVKKAVELIKNENYLFTEVAYHVGFSSRTYFTKCFKKVYGVSPTEYFNK
jgi:signal transduction histidine kinase/ligand-binding sensor domain-containing protein/DNA-binding response OmpR family regulator